MGLAFVAVRQKRIRNYLDYLPSFQVSGAVDARLRGLGYNGLQVVDSRHSTIKSYGWKELMVICVSGDGMGVWPQHQPEDRDMAEMHDC